MRRFLHSLEIYADFDFITYFITLKRDKRQQQDITNVLKKDYKGKKFNNSFEENVYCTVFHEVTHFLDLTTTVWGLEYSYRKLRVIKNNFDPNILDVFKLNVAEIEIFNDNKFSWRREIDFNNCVLTHSPVYTENWGAFIVVNIFKDFIDRYNYNLIAQIPINMLTVLETNAVATEYLIKLKHSISFPNEIEKEFDNFINDPRYIEYNILLLLLRRGFNFLTLEKLLIFTKYLIKISLNLDMFSLSSLANIIEKTFENKIIGNTIGMELRRGMSRDILVFKLILIFHSMIENDKHLKKELSQNPKNFLYKFLLSDNEQTLIDFSINSAFKMINEDTLNIFNYKLIEQSFLNNYPLLQNNIETDYLLKDFALPDILLEDQETIVTPPNRINFNIIDFFNNNFDDIYTLNQALKKDIYKFHMDPIAANNRVF